MYKIIVADSDANSLSIIERIVSKNIPDAQIVAVADNGNDAVVETINTDPDLILIAIKIAGLNGLETIARIRNFNKNVHIIIISAYDYFEFARKAMLLDVNDYVLKPFNERALLESITRELNKVKEENEREKAYRNEESQFTNALRFVEQHFIYSITYNMKMEEEKANYKHLLGIGDYGYIIGVTMEPTILRNQWDMEKVSNRVYRRLKDIIGEYASCAIGPRILNRYVIFITSSKDKIGREGQSEAVRLSKSIVQGLKDTFDFESKVAVGGIKPLKSIHDSYLEMIKSYRYDNESTVVYYKEVRYKNSLRETYAELTEQLIDCIRYDKQNVSECFDRILGVLRSLTTEERLTRLMELFAVISYEFRKELKNQDLYYDYIGKCDNLMTLSIEDQELWAARRITMMVRLMKSGKSDRKSTVITAAMEYVQKHYNEDVSLNDIANYVNLSPQHFSKIFKEATNYNYVEWVNNLRITRAKEYMDQDDYTIKEVCYLVGYKDPNYFSRIFKKYVGISPTEYVREHVL